MSTTPPKPKKTTVQIKSINTSPEGIQPREKLDAARVEHYTELYKDEHPLPDIRLFDVDGELRIADGYHRVTAAKAAGLKTIGAIIYVGPMSECLLRAMDMNSANGVPLTMADRKAGLRNIIRQFRAEGKAPPSLRSLAERCGMSHETVRREIESMDNGQSKRSADSFDTSDTPQQTREEGEEKDDWANAEEPDDTPAQGDQGGEDDGVTRTAEVERAIHDTKQLADSANNTVQALKSQFKRLIDDPVTGALYANHENEINESLKFLREVLQKCKPGESCEKCRGHGCVQCRQRGWFTIAQAKEIKG